MIDVPVGYKQTDVGVIPEDWTVFALGEIADVIMGQSPAGFTYNKSGDGTPLINGPTEFTDTYPIKVQWTTAPTKYCRKDDLLICVRGSSTGRMNISNDEYCIGRGVAAIRAKTTSNTIYLTSQIYLGIEKLLSLSAGSTFPNIDGKSIRSIYIPLPPTKIEQTAIATALSDVDALLNQLDKLIAKKRDIKQATMQQLLTGKKRLAGFSDGKGYKQTEIGEIPEDWDCVGLGDIADVIMGQSPAGFTYNKSGDGTPLINGPTEFTDTYPVKVQWTTAPTKYCKKDDLLICVRGSSTGRMNISNDEYCIGRGVAAIRAKTTSNTIYLTNQIHLGIEKLLSLSAGSTFPNIDGKSIRSIFIAFPALEEQTAIATLLTDMDTEITQLQQRRHKTHALKQGMMQQLLTGKIRLVA